MHASGRQQLKWSFAFLLLLVILIGGLIGYFAWESGSTKSFEWQTANEEMRSLLEQQQSVEKPYIEPKGQSAKDTQQEGNFSSETGSAALKKIQLNNATAKQLMTIPGIGESKAKAIVAHRNQIGSFTSIEQLLDVKGIGEKLLEKMKPYVTIET